MIAHYDCKWKPEIKCHNNLDCIVWAPSNYSISKISQEADKDLTLFNNNYSIMGVSFDDAPASIQKQFPNAPKMSALICKSYKKIMEL